MQKIEGSIVAEHDSRMMQRGGYVDDIFRGLNPEDCYLVIGKPGKKLIIPRTPMGDGIVTCYWCGRQLDNSLSQLRGVGPICVEKSGPMPGRENIEDQLAGIYNEYRADMKAAGKKPKGLNAWLNGLEDAVLKEHFKQLIKELS
jgi:hypothetical protein